MWLAENRPEVEAILASPLRRAQETAVPNAAAFGLDVMTDARLRERMNWDDDASIGLDELLAEWQQATDDRSYQPAVGDSSVDAADRFIGALVDFEGGDAGVVVVVTQGGVTVDEANADLISDGVPSCAITQLLVNSGAISVIDSHRQTTSAGQLGTARRSRRPWGRRRLT